MFGLASKRMFASVLHQSGLEKLFSGKESWNHRHRRALHIGQPVPANSTVTPPEEN